MASISPLYGSAEVSPTDVDRVSSLLADTLIEYVHSLSPHEPPYILDSETQKLCERVIVWYLQDTGYTIDELRRHPWLFEHLLGDAHTFLEIMHAASLRRTRPQVPAHIAATALQTDTLMRYGDTSH